MDAAKNIKRMLYNISPKTGKGTIVIYYSNAGKIKRFSTGVKMSEKEWDKRNHKPRRNALRVQDELIVDTLYNQLVKLITDYQTEFSGHLPPINYLEAGLNKPAAEIDIHLLFKEFIEARRTRLEDSSIENYEFTAKALKEADEHYKYFLNLNNFSYSFIEKFIEYSLKVKKNSNRTINLRLDAFITFVKWLDKKEIKHCIKTETWEKLDKGKTDLLCLERDELNAILEYIPKSDKEQRIKDTIVFLSHTGMRVTDARNLTANYIKNDCLEFYPQKTKRKGIKVIIPISKPVKEILKRNNNTVPVYTPKYLSDYIRDFCAKIELLKKEIIYKGERVPKYSVLTSHSCGRKTFLNLCIQEGIPIPTVMGFTGHTSMDTVLKSYLHKHINNLPQLSKVFEFEKDNSAA